MSFYRTYRPQVIDEIDNIAVREQLTGLLTKDRDKLPHAYFFTGPKGTGKTTAARVIAKIFNCEKSGKNGPCGTCAHCTAISEGSSLDVIEMDAASNRGIDEIRELRARIGLSPVSSAFTVYIIDEVHMLTTEAFNALLKTLEEPPAHAVFVLATTDAHKVPGTITSRCMTVVFKKAGKTELLHALTRVVTGEHLSVPDDVLEHIAVAADGSFRDAVKLLEQATLSGSAITAESLSAFMVSTGDVQVSALHTAVVQKNANEALDIIEKISATGQDMRSFVTVLLRMFEKDLVETVRTGAKDGMSIDSLSQCIRLFTTAYEHMRYTPVPELPLELAIATWCMGSDQKRESEQPKKQTVEKPERKDSQLTDSAPKNIASEKPVAPPASEPAAPESSSPDPVSLGLLTFEKLVEHWADVIASLKQSNHSVAGVMRSARPKAVANGIVTIEAFYTFHQEKLSDRKSKQLIEDTLKKLFGEKMTVDIVLGKK